MKILIACEFSGEVRRAFRALGHDAWSCDLPPASDGSAHHIEGDALRAIASDVWDMLIAFPPCTYVCGSGMHWNNRGRGWERTELAVEFFRSLLNCGVPRIAIENPVGILSTRVRKPDQTIQPYEFGEDASKRTCLWLTGLSTLVKDPAHRFPGRMVEWPRGSGRLVERWSNQTDSGQNKLTPSADRWAERSLTYPGIARAMASQWADLLPYASRASANTSDPKSHDTGSTFAAA